MGPWKWIGVVVPLVGLGELAADQLLARRAPTAEEWGAAKATLDGLRQNSELVVVAPHWAEPSARQAFGESLLPLRDLTRPDSMGYERAIEVSILGQSATELVGFASVGETRAGKFRFKSYRNPTYRRTLYDFADRLGPDTAEVFAVTGSTREDCPHTENARLETGGLPGAPTFPAARFRCSGEKWFFVGVTIIDDEQYRPRRCLWSHTDTERALETTFTDVPMGARLIGHGGAPYLLYRDDVGPRVKLTVSVDERPLGDFDYAGHEGWKGFDFATASYAGRRAKVTFRASASGAKEYPFCFEARTVEGP